MPGLKERAKSLVELLDNAAFLYVRRPLALDPKATELLGNGGRQRLAGILSQLEALPEWTAQSTEAAVRAYAEAAGVKLGQVAQPLRAALTGKSTSPPLFDVMAVLGRSETLARLTDQLAEAPA
jgi:glutamyl-tRNA synthetase